jgi:hypothetical protein
MTKRSPFRYLTTSPEIIRLAVMMYVRFPLSLRNVGDLLHERGIEICHETVRCWPTDPPFGFQSRLHQVGHKLLLYLIKSMIYEVEKVRCQSRFLRQFT